MEIDKKPRPSVGAPFDVGIQRLRSIAAVNQAPARAPWRRNQLSYIAAAIAIAVSVSIIARATYVEAGSTPAPAAMPATAPTAIMPAMTAPGRGGGWRQCSQTQRSRGNRDKREFAQHDHLLRFGAAAPSMNSVSRRRPEAERRAVDERLFLKS